MTPAELKAARAAQGLTQQAMADKAGIHLRQWQKLESGEILPENMALKNGLALAKALGVEPQRLIE